MKCLGARVNWMKRFANSSRLELLVDRIPKMEEFRFEQRDDLYFAELDGCVLFYQWGGKGKEAGFGGSTYSITMKDGRKVDLLGPWHVGDHYAHSKGFTPSLEVSLTTDPQVMIEGHTFSGGYSVTREWAESVVAEFLPGIEIRQAGSELYGQKSAFKTLDPFFMDAKPLQFFPCMIDKTIEQSKADAPHWLPLRKDNGHYYRDLIQRSAEAHGYQIDTVCRLKRYNYWDGRGLANSYLDGRLGAVRNGKVHRIARVCWNGDVRSIRWQKKGSKSYVPFTTALQTEDPSSPFWRKLVRQFNVRSI